MLQSNYLYIDMETNKAMRRSALVAQDETSTKKLDIVAMRTGPVSKRLGIGGQHAVSEPQSQTSFSQK